MDAQSLQFILPELILVGVAFVILMAGVFGKLKNFLGIFSLLGILSGAVFLSGDIQAGHFLFSNMLVNDAFSMFFRAILLVIAGGIVLLSMGYRDLDPDDSAEYYFFLLVVTASMMLAVSSNNLMMIYIALEAVSIISYIMAGYLKRDVFSSESGIKYFLFGTFSTGVTLYGISLAYGLFGSLDLNVILTQLVNGSVSQPALLLVCVLILAGFGFKCSLVPFHMWTPDVYQGAPTPVAALLSIGPKAMGFAFLLRVFVQTFQTSVVYWGALAGLAAILTMTVGNVMALAQNNMKRLLAFSSIAQAGYILVGLAAASATGTQSALFYLFVYVLMNLGAFAAVIAVANSRKSETMEGYAGLYKKDPFTAIAFAVCLLSLTGIPPFAGFLAKFFILASAVEAKFISLAVIMALNSVVALFYYVKIIKFMFLDEPRQEQEALSAVPPSPYLQWVLAVALVGNILIGFWPNPLINWLTRLLAAG